MDSLPRTVFAVFYLAVFVTLAVSSNAVNPKAIDSGENGRHHRVNHKVVWGTANIKGKTTVVKTEDGKNTTFTILQNLTASDLRVTKLLTSEEAQQEYEKNHRNRNANTIQRIRRSPEERQPEKPKPPKGGEEGIGTKIGNFFRKIAKEVGDFFKTVLGSSGAKGRKNRTSTSRPKDAEELEPDRKLVPEWD